MRLIAALTLLLLVVSPQQLRVASGAEIEVLADTSPLVPSRTFRTASPGHRSATEHLLERPNRAVADRWMKG
jgi:hypothetical protein